MVESSAKLRPWREAVKAAAYGAGPLLDGPLAVQMVFTLPRPKSAPKRDTTPYRTPDLSKLARSTEDAITDAGLWSDDARVSEYVRLAKVWSGHDPDALPVPGVVIACVERDGTWRVLLDRLFAAALAAAHDRAVPRGSPAPDGRRNAGPGVVDGPRPGTLATDNNNRLPEVDEPISCQQWRADRHRRTRQAPRRPH